MNLIAKGIGICITLKKETQKLIKYEQLPIVRFSNQPILIRIFMTCFIQHSLEHECCSIITKLEYCLTSKLDSVFHFWVNRNNFVFLSAAGHPWPSRLET